MSPRSTSCAGSWLRGGMYHFSTDNEAVSMDTANDEDATMIIVVYRGRIEALRLRRPVANRGHCSHAVVIRIPEVPLSHSFDQV